jgi:class 3 adenylate cyclase/tetratricopeptide (TPR) repeat protein
MAVSGTICPQCGADNDRLARFCASCAAPLTAPAPRPSEARKIVTIVFSDVTGFTSLGEALDPESLRGLMARYFGEMRAIIERHEGQVEKFVGDALMAVFGVPRAHEDDAPRALRAALEMRRALPALNEAFERDLGVRIAIRTGVNTGEVLSGTNVDGESFVTGDAVNVASRLESTAEAGEILIGEGTYRAAKELVDAESLPPLTIKGKSEPVAAWRLLGLRQQPPRWGRRLDAPLVGREHELRTLETAFDDATATRQCRLVTVMGPAGVGKSRLTGEFFARVGERARIIGGRCLPYGEGITFWPIVEAVREAAGIGEAAPAEAAAMIVSLLGDDADAESIAQRLAGVLGLAETAPGVQETFWSIRKLLEAMATRDPLVVAFDDIQWAEPTFLDLLEYLVDALHDVPVLIVCLARPEVLEIRGNWMTAKSNAVLVALEPLNEDETAGLIEQLLKGGGLSREARERIATAAEGNPLFVEETLRMLVDDGLLVPQDGAWAVTGDLSTLSIPPTIHALLAARLDRLGDDERAVSERASVVGRVFWWGAVAAMSPADEQSRVGPSLQSLSRKELIRPHRSDLIDEDAFRFAHILVADAAYRGIPKTTRADLHERFAEWLSTRTRGGAGEFDEFLGYHLEQAYVALLDLGRIDDRARALAERAAVPLAASGRRALARGDIPAAVNFFTRALALRTRDADPARLELLPELAFALLETGDFARVQELVDEAGAAAQSAGDRAVQARVLVLGLWLQLFTDPEGWAEEAHRGASRAIEMFRELGDERGLAKAWALLGVFNLYTCRFDSAEEAWDEAARHAAAAGDERERLEALSWIPLVVWGGPTPVESAIRRCNDVLAHAGDDRKAMATALFTRAKFEAMRGEFDEARELVAQARTLLEDIALTVWLAGPFTQMAAWVEILAGDHEAAEAQLRWGVDTLREIGEYAWLPTVAGMFAEAVYLQGRYDEADEIVTVGEETAGSEDAYSQALLRSVRAKSLARRGRVEEAEPLAREAIALLEPTDFLFMQAFARGSLGEVLVLAERHDALGELEAAARLADAKGFSVGAGQMRALAEVRQAT